MSKTNWREWVELHPNASSLPGRVAWEFSQHFVIEKDRIPFPPDSQGTCQHTYKHNEYIDGDLVFTGCNTCHKIFYCSELGRKYEERWRLEDA